MKANILLGSKVEIETGLLKDDADAAAHRAGFPVYVMAEKTHTGSGGVPIYGNLPLFFETLDAGEKGSFLARGPGYGLVLAPDGCVILGKPSTGPEIRVRCIGAKRSSLEGLNPLPGRVNYLLGEDPKKWRRGLRTWAKVRQQQVYEGIDLASIKRRRRYLRAPQQLSC